MYWIAVGAGALGLAALAAVGRAWTDLQGQTDGLVMTSSSGASGAAFAIPDLRTLTRMADMVVVGRVASDGVVRLLVQPAQTPIPFQPAAPPSGLSDEKATEVAREPAPTRSALANPPPTVASGPKIPITEYPFQIERVARGSAAGSQQITVLQTGGVFSAPLFPGGPSVTRSVQIEDDRLMKSGERYVLFLQRTPDGTFAVVGGPQGRLLVDSAARVHPLNPGSPALRGRDGQALDAFVADIATLQ